MRKLLLMCDNDWIYNCVELHFRMAAHIFFKKCVCWLIFIKTEYINHVIFCLPDLWVCIPKPKIIPNLGGIITLQCWKYCTPHENMLLLFLDQCLFFYEKWIKFKIDCRKFADMLWYINLVFPRSFI